MIYHNHLLVNGYTHKSMTVCSKMEQWLKDLVKSIDMKVVIEPRAFYIDKDGNKGITAQIGIETSHIAIHVWDECSPSLVQFDLYTCGPLDYKKVLRKLEKDLEMKEYKYLVLERSGIFMRVADGSESYENR